MVNKDFQYRTW